MQVFKLNHIIILICALVLLNRGQTKAQSEYYWMQNFNTESSLLAGAVVGGEAGPSAVFYNPALINQDNSQKFALSANLLSFQNMEISNLAGSETILDKFLFQVQPKFISYGGSAKKNKKLNYELAFLVPITTDVRFEFLFHDQLDIIHRLDGIEEFTGQITYRDKYSDYFVGGGIGYEINELFTIGVSSFFSIKFLDYFSSVQSKAMQNSDTVYSGGVPEPFYFASNSYSELLKYWDVSILFKVGFHYFSKNGNWGIGLNLTTPNISIYGEGDVLKEFYRTNIYYNEEDRFITDLAFEAVQLDVRTTVKDPFSIAFGFRYKTPNRKNAIMFTTEYFFAIDPYALLETQDAKVVGNMQVENVSEVMTYYSAADEVLNVGVGFVQYINENLTINGGFKTDFNTLTGSEQKTPIDPNISPRISDLYFDKFHIIAGPRLDVKRFGFVLGIQYTWGRQGDLKNMINLTDAVEFIPETNQALQGIRQSNMTVNYNEISLFFGITYGFGQPVRQ